jgi:activator of HSP90 ATPase
MPTVHQNRATIMNRKSMSATIMPEKKTSAPTFFTITRRQIIATATIALGALATPSSILAKPQQPTNEVPTIPPNQRTFLHQEVDFKATPQRVYDALLDSKQFAALTAMSADIDPKPGGAFTTFGGLIVGRNIELLPNQRIVQAWRPTHWPSGVYSIVKFELKSQASTTTIILDHTGFPEGEFDHLNTGWKPRYWDPLKKFLA